VFVLREGRTVAELKRDHMTEADVMRAMAHGNDANDATVERATAGD
jgi:ABC-type sugar transport system ATPase subunit